MRLSVKVDSLLAQEVLKVLMDEAESQVVAYELQDEVLAGKQKDLTETQRLRVQEEDISQALLPPFVADTSTVLVMEALPDWIGSGSGETASASRAAPFPYSTTTKRKRADRDDGSETEHTSQSIKRLHTESHIDGFLLPAVFICGEHAPCCGQCCHCTAPDITPNLSLVLPLGEIVVRLPSNLPDHDAHDIDAGSDLSSEYPGNDNDDDEDPDDSHDGNGGTRDCGQSKRKRSDRSQSPDDDSGGHSNKRAHADFSSTSSTSYRGFAPFTSSFPDTYGAPITHNERRVSWQGEFRGKQAYKTREDENDGDDIHISALDPGLEFETNAEETLCTACSDDLAKIEHGNLRCGHPLQGLSPRNDQRGEQESCHLARSMLRKCQPWRDYPPRLGRASH